MNTLIDLGTRAIVRGHNHRVRRLFCIFPRNSYDTLVRSANLVDSALPVKTLNGILYVIKSSKEAPIGWHTLRRSLATLLISNRENVKVAQPQLRHTTPKITLELYAQAVSADQQEGTRRLYRSCFHRDSRRN